MLISIARRFVLVLLYLALAIALWTTGLARISERSTAVPLLRDIGTRLINPILATNSFGVAQAAYGRLAEQAQSSPNSSLAIRGLKVHIPGSDLLDTSNRPLSFEAGTRAIYGALAQAYYDGGAGAAFDLPSLPVNLQSTLTDYGALAQFAQSHGMSTPIPQVPFQLLSIFNRLGLSPTTLTAEGHAAYLSTASIAWGVSGALGLALILLSRRTQRISSLSWAVFNSALPAVIVLAIAWFLVTRNATVSQLSSDFSGPVGGAFIPVYGATAAAGLGGVLVARALSLIERQRNKAASLRRLPAPTPVEEAAHPYPRVDREPIKPINPNADTVPF